MNINPVHRVLLYTLVVWAVIFQIVALPRIVVSVVQRVDFETKKKASVVDPVSETMRHCDAYAAGTLFCLASIMQLSALRMIDAGQRKTTEAD